MTDKASKQRKECPLEEQWLVAQMKMSSYILSVLDFSKMQKCSFVVEVAEGLLTSFS